jgi:hypothetical protein
MSEGGKAKGGKKHNLNRATHNKDRRVYVRQQERTRKNKLRAWAKHLKKYPNDEKAKHIIPELVKRET